MIINALVEKQTDIGAIALEIREVMRVRVDILRNLGVLIITTPDSVNSEEILEKIKQIRGIKIADLDCKIRSIR